MSFDFGGLALDEEEQPQAQTSWDFDGLAKTSAPSAAAPQSPAWDFSGLPTPARPAARRRPTYAAMADQIKAPPTTPITGTAAAPGGFAFAGQQPIAAAEPTADGLIQPGTIDLHRRPVVHNPDGSISTVRSIGVNVNGREVLIPTVSDDGRVLSDADAIAQFQRTGQHLGVFDTPEHATAFAQRLHEAQAQEYAPPAGPLPFARPGVPVQRARTGALYQTPEMGTNPVLDAPHVGAQQIARGARQIAAAATDTTPVTPSTEPFRRSRTGALYQPPPPIDPRTYSGAADIVEGATTAATPALVATGAAAPVETALALAGATLAAKGTEKAMQAAGATPEQTRLASTVAGAVAAGVPIAGIMRRGIGRTAEAARGVSDRAATAREATTRITPEPTDIPITPERARLPSDTNTGQTPVTPLSPVEPRLAQEPPPATPVAARPGASEVVAPVAPSPDALPGAPAAVPPAVAKLGEYARTATAAVKRHIAQTLIDGLNEHAPGYDQEVRALLEWGDPDEARKLRLRRPDLFALTEDDKAQARTAAGEAPASSWDLGGLADDAGRPILAASGYAGPERRAPDRVNTPAEDQRYQSLREKLARGEKTGTDDARWDFEQLQRVNAAREQGAIDDVQAMEPPQEAQPPEGMTRVYRGVPTGDPPVEGQRTHAYGRWFTADLDQARRYAGEHGTVSYVDLPSDYVAANRTSAVSDDAADQTILLNQQDADRAQPHSARGLGFGEKAHVGGHGEAVGSGHAGQETPVTRREDTGHAVPQGQTPVTPTEPSISEGDRVRFVSGRRTIDGTVHRIFAVKGGKRRAEVHFRSEDPEHVTKFGGNVAQNVDVDKLRRVTGPVTAASGGTQRRTDSTPVTPLQTTLTVHERRELRRMLAEMENLEFTRRTFNDPGRGRGGSPVVVGGAGGAPVFHDIGGSTRGQVAQAIRRVLDGRKPTSVGQRAIDVARGRLRGDPHLSEPKLPPSAGDEAGRIYVNRRTDLPPDEQRVHNAVADALEARPDQFIQDYRARYGKVVSADLAKELFPEYSASNASRSKYATAVALPSSKLARAVYRAALEETRDTPGLVVFTAGGTGSGKTSSLDLFPPLKDEAEIIYDSTLSHRSGAIEDIDAALGAGKQVGVVFTYRDVADAFEHGVLPRAMREGRTVTIPAHATTHTRAVDVLRAIALRYDADPNVDIIVVDNSRGGTDDRQAADLSLLERIQYDGEDVRQRLRAILDAEHKAGRISDVVYTASLPAEARAAAAIPPQTDRGDRREARKGSGEESLSEVVPKRLTTGERQPRLPADVGAVRDREIATPAEDVPFSLQREVAERRGRQKPMFGDASDTPITPTRKWTGPERESVGSPTRRAFDEPPGSTPVTPVSKQVRPSDIVRRVSKLFEDLPIKKGHFRERAFGIYKPDERVIRLRVENDLATLAHELGHHVDLAIFGRDLPYGLYKQELLTLGKQTSRASADTKTKLKEGAAEFFRLYVGDPAAARRQAPEYYQAFRTALEGHPEWAEAIDETQRLFQSYLAQDLATRGEARIDFRSNDATGVLREIAESPRGFLQRMEHAWVDDLAEARRVVEALESEQGQPVDYHESAYVLARLARGAAGKAQGFLEHGVRAADGTFLSGSLEAALKPIAEQLEDFSKFLVALRVVELRGRGIETGISHKESRAILDRYVTPGYIQAVQRLDATLAGEQTGIIEAQAEQAVAAAVKDGFEPFDTARRGVYAYQDAVLRYAKAQGALSAAQVTAARTLNRFYVPFQRVMEATQAGLTGTARRLANRGLPITRIRGSGRDIINPLESVIRNTFAIVDMVEKNKAMLALVDQASDVKGSGKFIERIPAPQVATTFNLGQVSGAVRDALEDAGVDLAEVLPDGGRLDLDELVTVFTPAQFAGRDSNIVSVIRSGEREWYSVNDQALYDTITAVGPQIAGWVRALSGPASWLRAGATLTLGFVARNPVRDTFTAGVQSRYGFIPVVDTVRGLFSYLKADEHYQDFLNSGAANAALVSRDRNQVRNELRRLTQRRWVPRNPIEVLRALSEATENATRLGEFRRAIGREGRTREGFARAGLAARDVTMDFARAGSVGRQVNQFAAFFNARVQGYARFAELVQKDARRARSKDPNPLHYASGRAAIYVALLSAIVWYLNQDDRKYEEIPDWEKNTYWHIPIKGGWIRVPKPFEWATVFGNTTEAALGYLKTKDPAKLRNLFPDGPGPTLRAALLSILPVAIMPWVENYANYDFFRDRPIVSPYDTDLPADLQYSRWTSATAKHLGAVMGVAPAKVEHLIYGYFAGLGSAALQAPGMLARVSGRSTAPAGTMSDVPVVGSFYRDRRVSSQATSLQDLYDASELLNASVRAAKIYIRSGERGKVDEIRTRVGALGSRKTRIDQAVTALRELRPAIDEIYRSTSMTPEAKRDRLDRLYEGMVEIARNALGRAPLGKTPVTSLPEPAAGTPLATK